MKTDAHKTTYLKDYKPYPFTLKHVDMAFDIKPGRTVVKAKIQIAPKGKGEPLFLHGEALELQSIKIDGRALDKKEFAVDDKGLTIAATPAAPFILETEVAIEPEKNTRLEGLYQSGGNYTTQCEAEGFRRITYYPDRPDVMTTFTVRIEADKKTCPVLLSNGNLVEKGEIRGHVPFSGTCPREAKPGTRTFEEKVHVPSLTHYAVWSDPFPKPCYLFALVAGDLTHIHDTYKTMSGRMVDLYIYVRHGDEDQCSWAMESLKRAMKWDEDVYGLEYDLDIFNIVAVSDFNMGAMENKSLNIFNTALVLAHQETATDDDFMRVESVIAHEYFHNWSGDRVTCRDWFQLSLKEGLTVFRDQEFSSDLHSRPVCRIDDVAHLRRGQFPEDGGPLAHPIRPDNYIEINNFYTMTVYEKGAEVIRMLRTIIGEKNYRKGTDLYFRRHDGQAVTCDDFVQCMQDASGVDLSHFKLWYSQAGTPEIKFDGKYDEKTRTYRVELSQKIPPTPGQPDKKPMFIPVAIGLLNENGDDMALVHPTRKQGPPGSKEYPRLPGESTVVLDLLEEKQTFIFENIASKPIPSVLRNFSAPVKLTARHTDEELAFLMVHDSDGFNKWEAGHIYAGRAINKILDQKTNADEAFLQSYGQLLESALAPDADHDLIARAMKLPEVSYIGQQRIIVDPAAIYQARQSVLKEIRAKYRPLLDKIYVANTQKGDFSLSGEAMAKRSLRNITLRILDDPAIAKKQYDAADNMTDRIAALHVLCDHDGDDCDAALADFYKRFREHLLVIDKWFSVQAMAIRPHTVAALEKLRYHPDFNIRNPNRARALYATFAHSNPVCFHAADGSGYKFLTDAVIELNEINPQIASRLLTPLREWRRYTPDRQEKMKESLQKILDTPRLSPDVFEIASKSLKN